MKVTLNLPDANTFPNGVVIALGNFDGMHLGHQSILRECVALAGTYKVPSAVMTFEPHPREFFSPAHTPLRIHSLRQKIEHVANLGIDNLLLMRFNQALASTPADMFVEELLHKRLGVKHVVTGYDFAFGKNRAGDGQFLTERARALNFGFTAHAQEKTDTAQVISSSAIREFIANGNLAKATEMLGHSYAIRGHVQHGEKRGRAIGYPTLNLSLKKLFKPRFGVYAARVQIAGNSRSLDAVVNIGVKPTFGISEALLEAHCFDLSGELYGKLITVELLSFLRDETKFSSLEELKEQIALDAQQAKEILAKAL